MRHAGKVTSTAVAAQIAPCMQWHHKAICFDPATHQGDRPSKSYSCGPNAPVTGAIDTKLRLTDQVASLQTIYRSSRQNLRLLLLIACRLARRLQNGLYQTLRNAGATPLSISRRVLLTYLPSPKLVISRLVRMQRPRPLCREEKSQNSHRWRRPIDRQ